MINASATNERAQIARSDRAVQGFLARTGLGALPLPRHSRDRLVIVGDVTRREMVRHLLATVGQDLAGVTLLAEAPCATVAPGMDYFDAARIEWVARERLDSAIEELASAGHLLGVVELRCPFAPNDAARFRDVCAVNGCWYTERVAVAAAGLLDLAAAIRAGC